MTEDAELLRRYVEERSEAAFTELAERHVNLVYSTALRLTQGNTASAQDISQEVFTELLSQAAQLTRHPALVGWLHLTTRFVALRANRTEQRRLAREKAVNAMKELLHDDGPELDWSKLSPILDHAIHELKEKDRHAVLLRFFQKKSLNEVGKALNLSENAARMRVERALEKLRGQLARQGITTTATALAVTVSAQAIQAAPDGFAAILAKTAIARSAVHASTIITTTKIITMTALQKMIITAALVGIVGTGIYTFHQHSQMTSKIAGLKAEQTPLTARVQQLEQENRAISNQLAALHEENTRLRATQNEREVLRLRGEVGELRRATASGAMTKPGPHGMAKLFSDPAAKAYMRTAMIQKFKSIYADFLKEQNLTPEQTDQLLQLLADQASNAMAHLIGTSSGESTATDESLNITNQLQTLLGDAGIARFKEFSEELPARTTVNMIGDQGGVTPLSDDQKANLIRIIKAEPADLTRGVLGAPDLAFRGTQTDIDNFLQQVAQSNQRIVQQASSFLDAGQLAALDGVLAKGIDSRKLQGAAFFPKN